ncbi:MAG: ABC-2 family transporter protein [Candidatus Promineofilum sp.]|nr:ABC-2 family transporter protein [Promineifilum sp.]
MLKITPLNRLIRVYGAIAAIVPKMVMAYSIWVWMDLFVGIIAVVILVAFWRAVYASTATLSGLTLDQTLNYILLAQLFGEAAHVTNSIYDIGAGLREGHIAAALLRPLDYQASMYVQNLVQLGIGFVLNIPLALFIWIVYGLHLPADPLVWLAFAFTLLLGHAVMFCFDWIVSCTAFYSTEIWGMSVVRHSLGLFLSGALIPLTLMPDWLRTIASVLPFSQTVFLPISILSGIRPLADMPRIWLMQGVMLIGLLLLSRFVFGRSLRVITVQGG